MFGKKAFVTAAITAAALISPAAALASGGASGGGKNSSSTTTAAPAECATITNATTTQTPQINMVTGEVSTFNLWDVTEHAQAKNCGTQAESLVWDISWINTQTGVVE